MNFNIALHFNVLLHFKCALLVSPHFKVPLYSNVPLHFNVPLHLVYSYFRYPNTCILSSRGRSSETWKNTGILETGSLRLSWLNKLVSHFLETCWYQSSDADCHSRFWRASESLRKFSPGDSTSVHHLVKRGTTNDLHFMAIHYTDSDRHNPI